MKIIIVIVKINTENILNIYFNIKINLKRKIKHKKESMFKL